MDKFFKEVKDLDFRIHIFTSLTSLWIILNFIFQIPLYESLWGSTENLILSRQVYGRELPFYLDLLTLYPSITPFVFFSTLVLALYFLLGRRNLLLRFMLWYFVWLLDAKAWTVQDGGNNLMHLSLFYAILMDVPIKWGESTKLIKGFAVRAIQAQILIVYFCAFISKMAGSLWQNGTALHYIVQIDKFYSSLLIDLFATFPLIVNILTYSTIIAQLLLFTLLPIARWRLIPLALGVLIHIGIAFHIGLIMFSLVMIFNYSIFLTKDDLFFAKERLKLLSKKIIMGIISLIILFIVVLLAISPNKLRSDYLPPEDLKNLQSSLKTDSKVLIYHFAMKEKNNLAEIIQANKITQVDPRDLSNIQIEYGSITKLITAIKVLELEKKGLLSRDDKIIIKDGSRLTLNELLFHRSGLIDRPYDDKVKELKNLYDISHNKGYLYSNINYVLVGNHIHQLSKNKENFEINKLKDSSLIKASKRPLRNEIFDSAFGIIGNIHELEERIKKIDLNKLPCTKEGSCWGGYLKEGTFFSVGKMASGTSLIGINQDGTFTILSSNDYSLALDRIYAKIKF